jgi:hypothetical protein
MVCRAQGTVAAMDRAVRMDTRLRCRKCFRTGTAAWEVSQAGAKMLLALSDGFHRRARFPLNLPPEVICDCGTAQPDHD